LNFDLVPCQIKDCEEAGRYKVTGNAGSVYVCATHALEIAEMHDKDPTWNRMDPDDD
jgi:hypothetical protein